MVASEQRERWRGEGRWNEGEERRGRERESTHIVALTSLLFSRSLWDDATHIRGRSPPLVDELSWETSSTHLEVCFVFLFIHLPFLIQFL